MKSRNITLATGEIVKFDEGANWIHGNSNEHPITNLAKDVEGLVSAITDNRKSKAYDMKSNDVSDVYAEVSGKFAEIEEKFEGLDPSISVKKLIEDVD